ncbi:MAG: ATP-binding cassette domain-containing protein [Christensenellales bacterium]|jgi:ABC-type multidrug transport system ATPase subunit
MVKFDCVTKIYFGNPALSNISFDFKPGQIYAVTGAAKSGKSTLINAAAGRLKPDSGSITFKKGCKNLTGYLSSSPLKFSGTVKDRLTAALLPNGSVYARGSDRLYTTIDAFELHDILNARSHSLRHHERQRVELASLLLNDYMLLALDEPIPPEGGDNPKRAAIAIKEYCNRTGCTVILAASSIIHAMRIADCLIVMDGGSIAEYGRPADVVLTPKTQAAAEHIAAPLHSNSNNSHGRQL